jgi:preprotein translocase subunit SecY
VTPGLDTEQYLAGRERELRTLGGLSMAALAAATQLFDAWCTRTLGVAIGTLNLLLLVGLITSAVRQVRRQTRLRLHTHSADTRKVGLQPVLP